MRFLRRKRDREQPPAAEIYLGLRQQALQLTPDQLGGAVSPDVSLLALLMETGYPEGAMTLVAVADGASSLYLSTGGGVIGAGAHAAVAEESQRWLEMGRAFLPQLPAITDPPPPSDGLTQLVAVTREGLRGMVAPEEELGEGQHSLSPLFHAGHDVITQIRLIEDD